MTTQNDHRALRAGLAHVLWLGGSTCAGKSSVAAQLGQQWSVPVYHYDRHEPDHVARGAYSSFLSLTMDERWVLRSPAVMAVGTIQNWTERFPLVVDDLLAMSQHSTILAEGAGLFPDLVAPLISDPGQALWLVATPDFLAAMRRTRGMSAPALTSDPERAADNIIARDVLMAEYVERRASDLGLAVVVIDGTRSLDEVTALVSQHFKSPREKEVL